jgi:hypothetical protein
VTTSDSDEVLSRRLAALEEVLTRRVAALETENFEMDQQLRCIALATDTNTASLSVLEESLDEITAATPDPEALAAVMAQRQAQLDTQLGADPHAGGGGVPDLTASPVVGDTDEPIANGVLVLAQMGGLAHPSPDATHSGGGAPNGNGAPTPPPELAVLHAWVAVHIAPLVRRISATTEGAGIRWCRQWWEHDDALTRFQALYLAFDELSQDESATWLSVYLRDHLDPHLATLTSPYGPFYTCHPDRHSDAFHPLGQNPLTQPAPDWPPVPVATGGHR